MKKIIMIIMAVALVALPTMAQDWQSTSTMQGSGSTYSSQVTGVGAAGVDNMATTTESYAPAAAGRRKMGESGRNPGDISTGSTESPLGDPVWPLMLMALAFGGYIAVKRRRKNIEI